MLVPARTHLELSTLLDGYLRGNKERLSTFDGFFEELSDNLLVSSRESFGRYSDAVICPHEAGPYFAIRRDPDLGASGAEALIVHWSNDFYLCPRYRVSLAILRMTPCLHLACTFGQPIFD